MKRLFMTPQCKMGTLIAALLLVGSASARAESPIVGRWDIIVHTVNGDTYPSWLEVRESGASLTGSYVAQFGSPRPISKVESANGSIHFVVPPQFEHRKTDIVYDGKLDGEV